MEVNNQDLYNTQQEAEESSSLNFGMIYKMVILNWKWFVLSIALCLGVAYTYLRYKTPIFQSTAKLLIKDDDNTKSHPDRFFFGPTGYKRRGLNLYAGLRLNF